MKAVTVETMRKMDETAIHTYGIPSTVLMEHAAMAVCGYFLAHIEKSKHVLIVCGPGNNGGDGFALARLLVQEGYTHVQLHCCVDYGHMSLDEAVFAKVANSYQIPCSHSEERKDIEQLIQDADIIVDALFGTGLSRTISGFYDRLILQINLADKMVISIDIASGIHGNSGQIMGCAIQADITLTFESYKLGQILYPGSAYSGKIIPLSIQMPKAIEQMAEGLLVLEDDLVKTLLPQRSSHSHKGTYGKALMIGGSKEMHGAVTMAAKAALRRGIGTLTLFVPDCITLLLASKLEESMIIGAASEDGFFAHDAITALKRILSQYDMIIIGNGMGRNEAGKELVRTVLESDRPCILDGDALYETGKITAALQRPYPTILTPHVKEMSYLSGHSIKDIQQDPIAVLKEFLRKYPFSTVALKDAHTIIANSQQMYLNLAGNHALAKGGSGDVLCGILAGLFGQSKDALTSAACAVYVHALTADLLLQDEDANSILPNDLIASLSETYQILREEE